MGVGGCGLVFDYSDYRGTSSASGSGGRSSATSSSGGHGGETGTGTASATGSGGSGGDTSSASSATGTDMPSSSGSLSGSASAGTGGSGGCAGTCEADTTVMWAYRKGAAGSCEAGYEDLSPTSCNGACTCSPTTQGICGVTEVTSFQGSDCTDTNPVEKPVSTSSAICSVASNGLPLQGSSFKATVAMLKTGGTCKPAQDMLPASPVPLCVANEPCGSGVCVPTPPSGRALCQVIDDSLDCPAGFPNPQTVDLGTGQMCMCKCGAPSSCSTDDFSVTGYDQANCAGTGKNLSGSPDMCVNAGTQGLSFSPFTLKSSAATCTPSAVTQPSQGKKICCANAAP